MNETEHGVKDGVIMSAMVLISSIIATTILVLIAKAIN